VSRSTAPLIVSNVSKRFGSGRFGHTVALQDVDLELPGGKLICFLGPSGCGKTTLLRIIAGLERPTQGRVMLGERDLTDLPVHKRNVGMVFQSFALFPHLSVAENVSYGLRIRGTGRRSRLERSEELLSLVRLSGLADRHISQLSGGQRQRVAMARALALEPSLFLLDEPLSALDAKLRGAMQVELRQLQQRLGITTIIVTHDQEEAMTMADVVVVMGDNRVQQMGSPLEVYRRPANLFVAGFLGTNNLLPANVASAGEAEVLGQLLPIAPSAAAPGESVTLSIRPENIRLHSQPPSRGPSFSGRVTFVRDLGSTVETFIDVLGHQLVVAGAPRREPGSEVWLELPSEHCMLLSE
jgi:putative spermidine/putrescine transport system ATP-binding protein